MKSLKSQASSLKNPVISRYVMLSRSPYLSVFIRSNPFKFAEPAPTPKKGKTP